MNLIKERNVSYENDCSENKRIIKIQQLSLHGLLMNKNNEKLLEKKSEAICSYQLFLKSGLELNQNVLYFSTKDKRFLVRTNELRAG